MKFMKRDFAKFKKNIQNDYEWKILLHNPLKWDLITFKINIMGYRFKYMKSFNFLLGPFCILLVFVVYVYAV